MLSELFKIYSVGIETQRDLITIQFEETKIKQIVFDLKNMDVNQFKEKYKLEKPFMLSGGISLDNLDEVINLKHPQFYGVDINSKFELEPGLKDIEKLKTAFEKLKR